MSIHILNEITPAEIEQYLFHLQIIQILPGIYEVMGE